MVVMGRAAALPGYRHAEDPTYINFTIAIGRHHFKFETLMDTGTSCQDLWRVASQALRCSFKLQQLNAVSRCSFGIF